MFFKCPDCSNEYDKLISLSLHYRKGHKKTAKELAISLNHGGQEPICKCGCGQPVKFLDVSRGFSEFVLGHAARMPGKNNWGNNTKAKEKSLETRKEMIKSGEWKPFSEKSTGEHWAKGKTAETDERIARAKASILNNSEEIERRSKQMKQNRLNGTIPTLYGSESSQWKGGISSLNHTCRSNARLYKEWKYPKLKYSEFKCSKCSSSKYLEVHHDNETFSEIYIKIANEMGWQKKLTEGLDPETDHQMIILKLDISEAVADYHICQNVSGVVLCSACHEEEHKLKNSKDCDL